MRFKWLLQLSLRELPLSRSTCKFSQYHNHNLPSSTFSFLSHHGRHTFKRTYSQTATVQHEEAGLRVAIVGSGPAGFYTARKLMREVKGTRIDMYEQLPVPFGLVRFGVAPDHPEVKNCQDEFEEVASSPNYTFIGNIELGRDLPLRMLANHYDAIVFAYGASKDRKLGLEGEEDNQRHIYSARAFVGWYNGLPEYCDLNPDLQAGETAIVVGQGNVALDVARILLSSVDALQHTDLTEHAIKALAKSTIKHVHVVGRRGPMQAAFTIKEVRELLQMKGVKFTPIPEELFPKDIAKLERPKKRLMQLLQKGQGQDSKHKPTQNEATATVTAATTSKSFSLDFLLSPTSLVWDETNPTKLTGVTFVHNELDSLDDPHSKVQPTSPSRTSTIATSTLFRSIGYKAEPIPGMDEIGASFDESRGVFRHDGAGRIVPLDDAKIEDSDAAALYCAGWVKRGPTGVIASTMADAFETAEAIVHDWRERIASTSSQSSASASSSQATTSTDDAASRGWPAVQRAAAASGLAPLKTVDWAGWQRIDAVERQAGAARTKPREKLRSVGEMMDAAQGAGSSGKE